jgi:hypothetical protein
MTRLVRAIWEQGKDNDCDRYRMLSKEKRGLCAGDAPPSVSVVSVGDRPVKTSVAPPARTSRRRIMFARFRPVWIFLLLISCAELIR